MKPYSILFVCMGNICRSPTAHGVFRHKVKAQGLQHMIAVDSAGTHNYHPGSPPNDRSKEHAAKRGMTWQTCGHGRSRQKTLTGMI